MLFRGSFWGARDDAAGSCSCSPISIDIACAHIKFFDGIVPEGDPVDDVALKVDGVTGGGSNRAQSQTV